MGYKPSKADGNLWYKLMVRSDDGFKYYAYILLYIDDCLCMHHNVEGALQELDHYFPMKPDSIGNPDIYLGAKLWQVQLNSGVYTWAMSPSKYMQDAVQNAET